MEYFQIQDNVYLYFKELSFKDSIVKYVWAHKSNHRHLVFGQIPHKSKEKLVSSEPETKISMEFHECESTKITYTQRYMVLNNLRKCICTAVLVKWKHNF